MVSGLLFDYDPGEIPLRDRYKHGLADLDHSGKKPRNPPAALFRISHKLELPYYLHTTRETIKPRGNNPIKPHIQRYFVHSPLTLSTESMQRSQAAPNGTIVNQRHAVCVSTKSIASWVEWAFQFLIHEGLNARVDNQSSLIPCFSGLSSNPHIQPPNIKSFLQNLSSFLLIKR